MKQENEKITIKWVDDNYFKEGTKPNTFILKTQGNFLWRLWFLISAPFIWLIKGDVKIK